MPVASSLLAKLKLQLATEEHQEAVESKNESENELKMTVSGMLLEALGIKENQCSIITSLKKKKLTKYQQTSIQKSRTALLCCI
ncbi:hypothetical protein Moror_15544 [Moniliophthora roreri MCA 2997]|uniref:Uncharacterized protein n=1 Tax=Moniliophthora roreri (strain MCA 2997) TaxID=1381753 RepID=V2WKG4_MONRO|nr:hypothetical protein Moror_15544 [Moniliophthora roreri MCA 2997]